MTERMRQLMFGTLRGRLIMGVALVHAVMMLLFLWDLTARQQNLILERQLEQAVALSQTLAVSSAGWVASRDLAGLQELAEAQKRYPELEFAMLLGLDGRVLAHTNCSKLGLYLYDLPADNRLSVLNRSPQLVDVVAPVQFSGRVVGWARVGIGQKLAGRKLAVIIRDGLLYALGAILVGSLMAWLAGRTVTRRLYIMQEVIDLVKAGDHQARIALAGSDEAARLSAEFNQMLDHLEQRVAERDRAEDLLQKSEEFLRNIVENIPAMVFVKDAGELRFVSLNKGAEELLGISREEMIGKNDYDFFPADQADHFISRDRAVLGMQGDIDVQEEEIQTRDGLKTLRTKKIAILDRKNNPSYLLGISEDITVRKQSEQALIEAKETAETVSRAKTEFLNMLSHELRTPLNGVLGGLQLLRLTQLDHEQQEYLDMITVSAEKELTLVGELLDLTDIEAGTIHINVKLFSLRDTVQHVLETFKPACAAKGIALALQLDEQLPDQLLGDKKRIEQVLDLLLDNALKFTCQGRIDLSVTLLEQTGSALKIGLTIADTGIGIPASMKNRIFEPFTQCDMSSTRRFGGTGVGLTICRRLLDILGGTIKVESKPNQGSCFLVELPCLVADWVDEGRGKSV
jgi:PAS domain S-box-containing protein